MGTIRVDIDASGATRGQKEVSSAFDRIQRDALGVEKSFGKIAKNALSFQNIIAAAFGGISVVALVKQVVSVGSAFEKQMAIVSGVMRATSKEAAMLTAKAREMGEATEWSATQAAQALQYMGMAGFNATQAIAALPATLDLATAGVLDLASATDIVTNIMTQWDIEAENLSQVNDILVATITRSNTNISEMGEAMKYVGGAAKGLGYDIEEVAAMLGVLANAGVKGGQAGTNLTQTLLRTQKAAKALGMEGGTVVEVLMEVERQQKSVNWIYEKFGVYAGKAAVALKTDISKSMQIATKFAKELGIETDNLAEVYKKAGELGRTDIIEQLDKAGGKLLQLEKSIRASHQAVDEFGNVITDKFGKALGEATVLANKMRDTTEGSFKVLSSVVESVMLDVFDRYKTTLKESVLTVADWIRENSDLFIKLASAIEIAVKAAIAYSAAMLAVKGIMLVSAGVMTTLTTAQAAYNTVCALTTKYLATSMTTFELFNTTLWGTQASLLSVSTALGVLSAGVAGFALGTWLEKNFFDARMAGIAFVDVTMESWIQLENATEELGISIQYYLSSSIASMVSLWYDFGGSIQMLWENIKGYASEALVYVLQKFIDFVSSAASLMEKIPGMEGAGLQIKLDVASASFSLSQMRIDSEKATSGIIEDTERRKQAALEEMGITEVSSKSYEQAMMKVVETGRQRLSNHDTMIQSMQNEAFAMDDVTNKTKSLVTVLAEGIVRDGEKVESNKKLTESTQKLSKEQQDAFDKINAQILQKDPFAARQAEMEKYRSSLLSSENELTELYRSAYGERSEEFKAYIDRSMKAWESDYANKLKSGEKAVTKATKEEIETRKRLLEQFNKEYEKIAVSGFAYETSQLEKQVEEYRKAGADKIKLLEYEVKKRNEINQKYEGQEIKFYQNLYSDKGKLSQEYLDLQLRQLEIEQKQAEEQLKEIKGVVELTEEDRLKIVAAYADKRLKIEKDHTKAIADQQEEMLKITDRIYNDLEDQTTSGRFEHELAMIQNDYDKFVQEMKDKDIVLSDEQLRLMEKGFADRRQKAYETYTKEGQVYKQMLDGMQSESEKILGGIFDGSIRSADDAFDSIFDSFKNMLLKMLAEAASKDLMAALFGGEGGNISGMLGGLAGTLGSLFGGGKSSGGGGILDTVIGGVSSLFGGSKKESGGGFLSGITDTISGWFGGGKSSGGEEKGFFSGITDTISGWFGGGDSKGPGLLDYVGGLGGAVGLGYGALSLFNKDEGGGGNDAMSAVDTLNQVAGEDGLLSKSADVIGDFTDITGTTNESLLDFSDKLSSTADTLTGITSSVTGYATAIWNAYNAFKAFEGGDYAGGTIQGLSAVSGGMAATAAAGGATGLMGTGTSAALTSASSTIGAVGAIIAAQNMATGSLKPMSYGTNKYQMGNVFSGWGQGGSGSHGDMWNEPWREWLMQEGGAGPGAGAVMDMQIRAGEYGEAMGNLMTDTALYWFMPIENTLGNLLSENLLGGGKFGKIGATMLGLPTGGLFGADVNEFTMSELVKGSTMDQGQWGEKGLGSAKSRGEFFSSGQAGDHWYNQIAGTYYQGIAEIGENYNKMVEEATSDMPEEVKASFQKAMEKQDWGFESLLTGTWEVPDANEAIQAIWANYSKQLIGNFTKSMGVVSEDIGNILQGVADESGLEEALSQGVSRFGLTLNEKIAKYADITSAVKLAMGGVNEEEGQAIIRKAQTGYISSGGEIGDILTDSLKESLRVVASGELKTAFEDLANGIDTGADLIDQTSKNLSIPVEQLAQLVSGDDLQAAGAILVGLADTWININSEIDKMISELTGESTEGITEYRQAFVDLDDYFVAQTKTLEDLGFTESALAEIEAKRLLASDALKEKFASQIESVMNDVSSYESELAGTTNEMRNAISDVKDKYDEWAESLRQFGASEEEIEAIRLRESDSIGKIAHEYENQRNAVLSAAEAMAGHTQEISEYDSAIQQVNSSFDDMIIQLKTLGASVDEVTALEALRAEALEYQKQQFAESRENIFKDVSSYSSGLLGKTQDVDPIQQAMDEVANQFAAFREDLTTKGGTQAELEKLTREEQRATSIAVSNTQAEIDAKQQEEYQRSVQLTMDAMADATKAQQESLKQQAEAEKEAQDKALQNAIDLENLMSSVSDKVADATGEMTSYEKAMSDINKEFDNYRDQIIKLGGDQDHLGMLEQQRLDMVQVKLIEFGKNVQNVFESVDDYMSGLTGESDIVGDTIDSVNDKFDAWRETIIDNGASQMQVAELEKKRLQATKLELQNLAQTVSDKFKEVRDGIEFSGGNRGSAQIFDNITKLMGAESFSFEGLSSMADMLVDWYNAAVSEAESAVSNMASESNEAANQWSEVSDKTQSLIDSINDTMDAIKYSNLNIALPVAKLSEATQDYNELFSKAQAGGEEDIKAFTGFVQQYLGIAQAEYKSSQAYQDVYAQVMNDLGAISQDLSSGTYEDRLLSAVESMAGNDQINQQIIEANLTGINNTFEEIASWIETQIGNLEEMRMFLDINWQGLSGDAQSVIEMMSKVVDEHGWNSEVTMSFVSEMADNFTGPFESNMELLNYVATESGWESDATLMFLSDSKNFDTGDIEQVFDSLNLVVTESGGWESEATLSFLSNTSLFSTLTLENQMKALGFVTTQTGWGSTATATMIANLGDQGVPWASVKSLMESQGMKDDTVTKQIMASYYSSYPEWSTWSQLEGALKTTGIDDTTIKSIQGNYTGNMSAAELHTLLSAAGVSDNVIATINEQVRSTVDGTVQTDLEPGMNNLNSKMDVGNAQTSWLREIHGYLGYIYNNLIGGGGWLKEIHGFLGLIYNTRLLSNQRGYEYGGMSYGPTSGYQALLHGNELVVSPKRPYENVSVTGWDGGNDRSSEDREQEIELLKQIIANQQKQLSGTAYQTEVIRSKSDKQVMVLDTQGIEIRAQKRTMEQLKNKNYRI